MFLPRYAVFDGIRAVFSSGFLLFRFLKLDQPRRHHDFFDGHEPYAQAVQKLGRHDLGGQLQRRRAAAERAAGLRTRFGRRLLGPMTPPVDRIRGEYLLSQLLKIESGASSARARELLAAELKTFSETPAFKAVTDVVNVDPP